MTDRWASSTVSRVFLAVCHIVGNKPNLPGKEEHTHTHKRKVKLLLAISKFYAIFITEVNMPSKQRIGQLINSICLQ